MSKHVAPNFLNDDGTASIASALLMSHHGLRRDLALFGRTLPKLAPTDKAAAAALQGEWASYRATLHGHHTAEDNGLFPGLRKEQPSLAPVLDQLDADHKRIDPLLARGDEVFKQLPDTHAAIALVTELSALLDAHLALEESNVVGSLRSVRDFPPPPSEAELAMYAQGFAWSAHGVAPEVLERVFGMLPEALRAKLPAARAEFEARCERVWGTAKAGASRTAAPDWL